MAARLDFEIDSELETGLITGHAGVPGLIEAFRQTGTAAVIDREIQLKSRKRGSERQGFADRRRHDTRRTRPHWHHRSILTYWKTGDRVF